MIRHLILLIACASTFAASALAGEKVCGVYTSVNAFAGQKVLDEAIAAEPAFLMEKHKKAMARSVADQNIDLATRCGFNTLFMTIYPLWGKDWWDIPAARAMVQDAVDRGSEHFQVHLGLSLFNAHMCADPSRFPGASRTIQCDGTRPSWICFLDDGLWDYFIRNAVEMARVGKQSPKGLAGIFIDPEAYGPECYLCFCDNCVEKFNAWSGQAMPKGLVKPDSWLYAHGLWKKYTVDWHDQEVRRHAEDLRKAVHAINPDLQLSSLLWDYPVAVGIGDARQGFFRNLAIGLGTRDKPAWTLPEHTYYSDAADLKRIIEQVNEDIEQAGAAGQVQVLPGIRLLRQSADSVAGRAEVIRDAPVPGYWLYELSDLGNKTPIDFEGELVEPVEKYIVSLSRANRIIRQGKALPDGE